MDLRKLWRKIFRFLASLKLAVIVLSLTTILAAVGTIVESRYNAETAQKLIYYSIYMKTVLFFMALSLIFSVLERWPWKPRHTGFIVTHTGIIAILLGSYITSLKGVDGTMVFGIGERNRFVSITTTDLTIYEVPDSFSFDVKAKAEVDFLVDPPSKNDPFILKVESDELIVDDYYPYAFQRVDVEPSEETNARPAVRFQLYNDRVNITEWIQQTSRREAIMDLGPARVVLSQDDLAWDGKNEVILTPEGENIKYTIYHRQNAKPFKKGKAQIGALIETGWMGLKLRLLNHYPKAQLKNEFTPVEFPTPVTTSAIRINFKDKIYWLGLNSAQRIFVGDKSYVVTYANRKIDVGFDMLLKKFEIGRYQGTFRAASYKSLVEVPGLGEVEISMNEPLKHNGFTFYQASFIEDPNTKEPVASVLSVNYDPGRWLKYLGSALVVLGALLMFYFGGYFGKKKKIEG